MVAYNLNNIAHFLSKVKKNKKSILELMHFT